jgi:hypothetical protein
VSGTPRAKRGARAAAGTARIRRTPDARAPGGSVGGERPAGPPGLLARFAGAFPPQTARWAALPSALLLTLLVHWPALRTFFAQDDLVFLARATGLEPSPVSFWRVLSGTPRWRLFHALFGLNPLPYHLANLLLHLGNVALVYAVARRLAMPRGAAWAAAVLFGASGIAFTPLHWATGFMEIFAATWALAALLLFLAARGAGAARSAEERERPGLLWVSALAVLAAGLSKEATILLPLVLVAADRRLGACVPRARSLIPAAVTAVLFVAVYAATFRSAEHLGGAAYALSVSPAFIARNLATYLRWTAAIWNPVRDAVAGADPRALPLGLAVAAAAVLVLVSQWRASRHPEELGAIWFLALLAPVLPLAHHTYLYYLYVPWAGACWLAAAAGTRLARRLPALLPLLLGAVLAFAAVEARGVRVRETAMTGPFAADRTIRESTILANVLASLDSARLAPGARVAFVNPAPKEHVSATGGTLGSPAAYNPFEQALRGGLALQVFRPAVRCLGVVDTLPRGWEDVEVFLYDPDGRSRHLGHGGQALSALGDFARQTGQLALAERMLGRSLALGDTTAEAIFGLGYIGSALGRPDQARAFAQEFVRRWPHDPRARGLERTLREEREGR